MSQITLWLSEAINCGCWYGSSSHHVSCVHQHDLVSRTCLQHASPTQICNHTVIAFKTWYPRLVAVAPHPISCVYHMAHALFKSQTGTVHRAQSISTKQKALKAPSTKHNTQSTQHKAQSAKHKAHSQKHKAHAQTRVYGLQVFTQPIQALPSPWPCDVNHGSAIA